MSKATEQQPPPTPSTSAHTVDLVLKDLQERKAFGFKKYGVYHQPDNGRDHRVDLYQELLDGVVYLRAELEKERTEFAFGYWHALAWQESCGVKVTWEQTDAPAKVLYETEVARLEQKGYDLARAEGLDSCAYCERVFGSSAEVREHVLTCDKHPMSAMAKKLSKARRLLKKYKKAAEDLEATQALADNMAAVLATTKAERDRLANENLSMVSGLAEAQACIRGLQVENADLRKAREEYQFLTDVRFKELEKARASVDARARANEAQLVKENASKVSSRDLQDALDIQNSLRETIKGLNERLNTVTGLYAEAKDKLEQNENKKQALNPAPFEGSPPPVLEYKANGHSRTHGSRTVFCPTRGNAHVRTQYSLFDGPKEICSACGGEL